MTTSINYTRQTSALSPYMYLNNKNYIRHELKKQRFILGTTSTLATESDASSQFDSEASIICQCLVQLCQSKSDV